MRDYAVIYKDFETHNWIRESGLTYNQATRAARKHKCSVYKMVGVRSVKVH